MRERHTQPLRLHGQPRRGEAPHGPADEYQIVGMVNPLAGEVHRGQQVGAAAVVGGGIPVGSDHTQTMSSNQLGKRSY